MKATFLVLLCALPTNGAISCMNMDNNPVDWFIFYKLPRLKESPNAHVANGTGFLYLDSTSKDSWTMPRVGMETENHAVFYTLQHYYQTDRATTFSIMYNDEFPNSTVWSDDSGHTKGVSVFDQQTGYWLIHSIPKFPSNQSYEYPSNAHTYGQMGICISFGYQQLGDISQQLWFNQPFIYQMSVPPSFGADFPVLLQVQQGLFNTSPPYTRVVNIRSLGGQRFTSFAKSGQWGKDLYYDLVAPSFSTNLDVETWQHGNATTNLYSWCSSDNTTEVLNVEAVRLPFGINFTNYYDHSKYAVAFNLPGRVTLPWVCVGDINRQVHQMVRGGGTICINDPVLSNVYTAMISETYYCRGTHPPPSKNDEKSWLRVNRIPV